MPLIFQFILGNTTQQFGVKSQIFLTYQIKNLIPSTLKNTPVFEIWSITRLTLRNTDWVKLSSDF